MGHPRTEPAGRPEDADLLVARDTAAQGAQVSRVCYYRYRCPVEDTDLRLRTACLRIIALFREPGVVSLQKFFPIWISITLTFQPRFEAGKPLLPKIIPR